jgi:type I restriction enzyme S subunit
VKKGWDDKRLADCCEIVNGGTPKSSVVAYWGGEHSWVTPAEMGGLASPYLGTTRRTLTDAGLKNSSARLLPPQSVILSSRAPIGHLVINTVPMATNQGCKGLVPKAGLEALFLYYCLLGMVPQLDAMGTGATFKELSAGKLKEVCIPVPPLPEQRRIVAILDEAFEGIAAAKANAEKNLRNAKEVFEAWLRAVFYERRPEWPDKLLKEVCGFENGDRGKNYPNRSEYVDAGIPWINTGHIQPDGTLSINEMNFISKEKYESLRSGKIQPGDLVYCLRGATLGKTALVEPYTVGAIASSLVILRPAQSLNSRFLYYFLTSPVGQGLIRGYENGAAQPNLGAKSVAKYRMPTPSPAEQQRFVKLLDDVSGETSRLTGIYKQKLTALDALKASLLHQAFTGQL